MATLRKAEIVGRVAARLGGGRSQGDAAVRAVLSTVEGALRAGDRVVLTGFGAFQVRDVKARQVRAIRGRQQGQRITVPPHKRVRFTPGSQLASSIRR